MRGSWIAENIIRDLRREQYYKNKKRAKCIVDKLDYKSVYIEIQTKDNKYTLEREKERKIGFSNER